MNVIAEDIRVARKVHECSLCGLDIAKGERHLAQFCKDGGDVYTARAHLACQEATERDGWDAQDFEYNDQFSFRTETLGMRS